MGAGEGEQPTDKKDSERVLKSSPKLDVTSFDLPFVPWNPGKCQASAVTQPKPR